MKKIKDLLFKKRIKILKNQKGFTLMEVLVAVGLIGIITAIAVPQFQDYREQTGLVAGDASTTNMARAYKNCVALNDFASCNTLDKIGIKCEGCTDANPSLGNSPPFCANFKSKAGAKEFKMCVSVSATENVSKSIGGAFQVCHKTCALSSSPPQTCDNGTPYTNRVMTPIKRCKNTGFQQAHCGPTVTGITYSCPTTPNTIGECGTGALCT